jgi:hypothetical protein
LCLLRIFFFEFIKHNMHNMDNMINTLIKNSPKYFLEGAAVAIAAFYIPNRSMALTELLMLAITASLTFWLLDVFAPGVSQGARLGAGFGIGGKVVGFERFCGDKRGHDEGI